MSFLRKRRRSQSSGSNKDVDCISTRSDRKEPTEKSIIQKSFSGVSDKSTRPDDYGSDDSCVHVNSSYYHSISANSRSSLRNFSKHNSSHLRFLAWVAYRRKYDDCSITEDERRTCPLLWCREVFPDQETMLKHVWKCEHLSKGLYWCFHCQRPERVGKFQCRRCQGLPSKTDRLTTVAKRIFSRLGTKHHKEDDMNTSSDSRSMAPTLEKKSDSIESAQFPEVNDNFVQDEFPPYEPLPELPSNCIAEMENTSIVAEMESSWNINLEELQRQDEPSLPSNCSPGLYSSMVMDSAENAFSDTNPPWSPSSFGAPAPAPAPAQRSFGRSLPALALNTRDIYQPPRHRDNRTGVSDEPMSATIISPLSATEGFSSSVSGREREHEISPTDSDVTSNSFFTNDSGYLSATVDSAWSANSISMDFARIYASQSSTEMSSLRAFPTMSRDDKHSIAEVMQTSSQTHSAMSSNAPSRSSSNSSNHSANRCTAAVRRTSISSHWKDSKSLVISFAEVLEEHLRHSRNALNQLPSTSSIRELLSMSSASIISIGFGVLRGLLEKRNPTAIIEIFAFAHIAYAAAIAVDEKSSNVRSEGWFRDSLCWLSGLSSERQKMSYTLIVHAIWKPQDLTVVGDCLDFSRLGELIRSSGNHENRLVKACRQFLDIQENLINLERSTTSGSSKTLNLSQASFYRTAKHSIIDELIQQVSIEAFIEDVVAVERRLEDGEITDLRQMELELICAGKLASQSSTAYDRFVSHVTCLCDTLYSEGESEKSRVEYQIADIDVTKSLIPEEGACDENRCEEIGFDGMLRDQHTLNFDTEDSTLDSYLAEADSIFEEAHYSNPITTPYSSQTTALARSRSDPNPPTNPFHYPHLPTSSSTKPEKISLPPPQISRSISTSTSGTSSKLMSFSKEKYKCHCGYVPQGEERWKPSNLARHKRTQHPVQVKIYRCRFAGCVSTFTRSDNLRSHVRDKGHELLDFEGGEDEGESERRRCRKRRKLGDNGWRVEEERKEDVGFEKEDGNGADRAE